MSSLNGSKRTYTKISVPCVKSLINLVESPKSLRIRIIILDMAINFDVFHFSVYIASLKMIWNVHTAYGYVIEKDCQPYVTKCSGYFSRNNVAII